MDFLFDRLWSTAKVSPKGRINYADVVEWLKNALIFLAPTLVVLLPSIVGIIPTEWKYAAVIIYVLNRLTDLIRRFITGK